MNQISTCQLVFYFKCDIYKHSTRWQCLPQVKAGVLPFLISDNIFKHTHLIILTFRQRLIFCVNIQGLNSDQTFCLCSLLWDKTKPLNKHKLILKLVVAVSKGATTFSKMTFSMMTLCIIGSFATPSSNILRFLIQMMKTMNVIESKLASFYE